MGLENFTISCGPVQAEDEGQAEGDGAKGHRHGHGHGHGHRHGHGHGHGHYHGEHAHALTQNDIGSETPSTESFMVEAPGKNPSGPKRHHLRRTPTTPRHELQATLQLRKELVSEYQALWGTELDNPAPQLIEELKTKATQAKLIDLISSDLVGYAKAIKAEQGNMDLWFNIYHLDMKDLLCMYHRFSDERLAAVPLNTAILANHTRTIETIVSNFIHTAVQSMPVHHRFDPPKKKRKLGKAQRAVACTNTAPPSPTQSHATPTRALATERDRAAYFQCRTHDGNTRLE
jgi:hypothetical protein